MAIDMNSLRRGSGNKPPIGIIYGRPGIGKTTLAAFLPGVVFLQSEDGLTSPALSWVPTFGVMQTYEDFMGALETVANNAAEQGWKSAVIDSIDRLNPLIIDYVCRANNWKTLEDGAYGKGKVALVDAWRHVMNCFLAMRNEVGLSVIMLGHSKAIKMTPPDSDPYTQWNLTLHEDVSRILIADSDLVLFATYPITTSQSGDGLKKVNRAHIDKPRLYAQERGGVVAKNRYGIGEFIPMDWPALAKNVPVWAASLQAANAAAE